MEFKGIITRKSPYSVGETIEGWLLNYGIGALMFIRA